MILRHLGSSLTAFLCVNDLSILNHTLRACVGFTRACRQIMQIVMMPSFDSVLGIARQGGWCVESPRGGSVSKVYEYTARQSK